MRLNQQIGSVSQISASQERQFKQLGLDSNKPLLG